MEPIPPFWFKQRQCRLEAAGENAFKAAGPNLPESYLRIFAEDGRWKAAVRSSADGPDDTVTADGLPTTNAAWEAAFELYRNRVVI